MTNCIARTAICAIALCLSIAGPAVHAEPLAAAGSGTLRAAAPVGQPQSVRVITNASPANRIDNAHARQRLAFALAILAGAVPLQ